MNNKLKETAEHFDNGETFFFKTRREQAVFAAKMYTFADSTPVMLPKCELTGFAVRSVDFVVKELYDDIAEQVGEEKLDRLLKLMNK